jgi:hypothetical protein
MPHVIDRRDPALQAPVPSGRRTDDPQVPAYTPSARALAVWAECLARAERILEQLPSRLPSRT